VIGVAAAETRPSATRAHSRLALGVSTERRFTSRDSCSEAPCLSSLIRVAHIRLWLPGAVARRAS
jgi:hypothetical protein